MTLVDLAACVVRRLGGTKEMSNDVREKFTAGFSTAQVRRMADICGISLGRIDGGPYSTIQQLMSFAVLAADAAHSSQQGEIERLRAGLIKIREKCSPGREIDIHDAIDLICECWNDARSALSQSQSIEGGSNG